MTRVFLVPFRKMACGDLMTPRPQLPPPPRPLAPCPPGAQLPEPFAGVSLGCPEPAQPSGSWQALWGSAAGAGSWRSCGRVISAWLGQEGVLGDQGERRPPKGADPLAAVPGKGWAPALSKAQTAPGSRAGAPQLHLALRLRRRAPAWELKSLRADDDEPLDDQRDCRARTWRARLCASCRLAGAFRATNLEVQVPQGVEVGVTGVGRMGQGLQFSRRGVLPLPRAHASSGF